ncbi:MAG: hypothetical protein JST90_17210 [Bacteroidetes bacterium]|nr:hypothetical protein [Bacteroidota bacterium]
MNLSEAEIESFRKKLEIDNERHRLRSQAHDKLYSLYKNGQLPPVKPLWHLDERDIDFSKQKDNLEAHHFSQGFTIIPDVPIDLLLANFPEGVADMFHEKKLFREEGDLGTTDILTHWSNNEKLIPPTFMVMDKTMHDYCDPNSKEIYPFDGKHRLNAAYSLGETHVPILVTNKQLAKIKTILGI